MKRLPTSKLTLDAFLSELWTRTTANPLNPRERIYGEHAAIEAKPFGGRIHIIVVRSFEKGQGYGSTALDFLCKLADTHQVEMGLNAVPVKQKGGLTRKELIRWYERRGFEMMRSDYMVRKPNQRIAEV